MSDKAAQDPRDHDARPESRPVDLGLYAARGVDGRMTSTEWVAVALCAVWFIAVATYVWRAPPEAAPDEAPDVP